MPRAKGRLPKCCHTDGVDGSIALLGTCCVGFTPVVSLPSGEIKESHRVESAVVGLGGEGGDGGDGGVGHWSTQRGWFVRLQCSHTTRIRAILWSFRSTHKSGLVRLQLRYHTTGRGVFFTPFWVTILRWQIRFNAKSLYAVPPRLKFTVWIFALRYARGQIHR